MAYSTKLADRTREYLSGIQGLKIEEKKMFGGLAFLVNGKMCVNIGEDMLMCRFEPCLAEVITKRKGFLPMTMKGKQYKGYCYVEPIGYENKKDFEYWINLCLDFNDRAKPSKRNSH